MPLEPSDLIALAAACAPAVAPPTLLALTKVESGLEPLVIGVNGPQPQRLAPRSTPAAIAQAARLIAAGRNVDLGLAQINVRNLAPLGLTLADAFDPCRNLAASARLLAEGYRRANPQSGGEQVALRTALSFYNTGDAERGYRNGYVARVVAASRRSTAAGPEAAARPWDVFGRARSRSVGFVFTPSLGDQP
jgi:type IV secretion system protein VirB1